MYRGQAQFAAPRMTFVVKVLLIVSVVVFLAQLALETQGLRLGPFLGFVPARLLEGWIWQPFTYPFLHAGLFHILFNMLVVWMIGAELEALWGRATFLAFFFVCALGAALTYSVFALVGIGPGPHHAVVGSSGAVYGLLLAYGVLFGDRQMYFFMIFPMPAKYFVALLGAIELVSSVFYSQTGIAHTAHLGGMVFGFLFLMAMASWRRRAKTRAQVDQAGRERKKRLKKASGHLRLVNDDDDSDPKTWN